MKDSLRKLTPRSKRSLSLLTEEAPRLGNKPVIYKSADAYKTTCRMTRPQNKRFRSAIAREGYSVRKKSLWVSEALHDFFSDERWMDALSYIPDTEGKSEPEKFNLDPALKALLESGEKELERIGFKGASISEIIRNAIDMRVLRRGRYNASSEEEYD